MEVITLTTYLGKTSDTVKAIRTDEVPVFCQAVLNRYKKTHGSKCSMHQLLAVVNLSHSRIVRMKGKVWDAVSNGDCLWFVKVDEWQDYTDNHLVHEPTFRHGKRIVVRHPSFLSPEKLQHFISQYFDDCKPLLDKSKRWVSPNAMDNSRRISNEEKSPSHESFRPTAADMNFVNALKEALVSPFPVTHTLMESPFPVSTPHQFDSEEENYHNMMYAADEEKRLSQSTFDDLSRISDLSVEMMQGLPSFDQQIPAVIVDEPEPAVAPQREEPEMPQVSIAPTENDDMTDVQSTIIPESYLEENIKLNLSPTVPHVCEPLLVVQEEEEEQDVVNNVHPLSFLTVSMTLQEKIELANVLNDIVEQVASPSKLTEVARASQLIVEESKLTEEAHASQLIVVEQEAVLAPAPNSVDYLMSSVDDNQTIGSMRSFGQSADSLLDYERVSFQRESSLTLRQPSSENDLYNPSAAVVQSPTLRNAIVTSETEEVHKMLEVKSRELEEATRARIALEARLEETRYLLQLFAGTRTDMSSSSNKMLFLEQRGEGKLSAASADILALEESLKHITLTESITMEPSPRSGSLRRNNSTKFTFQPALDSSSEEFSGAEHQLVRTRSFPNNNPLSSSGSRRPSDNKKLNAKSPKSPLPPRHASSPRLNTLFPVVVPAANNNSSRNEDDPYQSSDFDGRLNSNGKISRVHPLPVPIHSPDGKWRDERSTDSVDPPSTTTNSSSPPAEVMETTLTTYSAMSEEPARSSSMKRPSLDLDEVPSPPLELLQDDEASKSGPSSNQDSTNNVAPSLIISESKKESPTKSSSLMKRIAVMKQRRASTGGIGLPPSRDADMAISDEQLSYDSPPRPPKPATETHRIPFRRADSDAMSESSSIYYSESTPKIRRGNKSAFFDYHHKDGEDDQPTAAPILLGASPVDDEDKEGNLRQSSAGIGGMLESILEADGNSGSVVQQPQLSMQTVHFSMEPTAALFIASPKPPPPTLVTIFDQMEPELIATTIEVEVAVDNTEDLLPPPPAPPLQQQQSPEQRHEASSSPISTLEELAREPLETSSFMQQQEEPEVAREQAIEQLMFMEAPIVVGQVPDGMISPLSTSICSLQEVIIQQNQPLGETAVDDDEVLPVKSHDHSIYTEPLLSLMNYHKPFLIAARFAEDSSIRGFKARHELMASITEEELLFWIIFQIYGSVEGITVKQIKTTQISRALQSAKIGKVPSSQLDLLLVKIHAKLAAQSVGKSSNNSMKRTSSQSKMPQSISKTGTVISAATTAAGRKSISVNPRTDPASLNSASFAAYVELLHQVRSPNEEDAATRRLKGAAGEAVHLERIKTCFKELLQGQDYSPYSRYCLECQPCWSGIVLRTVYAPYMQNLSVDPPLSYESWLQQARRANIATYSDSDVEHVRGVWDRNQDQFRQIYSFYATALETRRLGTAGAGPLRLLLSVENCKEMLQDFHILPHLIDVQNFYRLFRSCKLWEWEVAEFVIRSLRAQAKLQHMASFNTLSFDPIDHQHFRSDFDNRSVNTKDTTHVKSGPDPYDFLGSVGHLSLSYAGFAELLTRIACFQNKLGNHPQEALENALHLMDASEGKTKLIKANRKSISVRHFVYSAHHK